jgi:hypothetical protein
MQTGQNSIAPENSLPQLGQVRWDSVLMDLPAFFSPNLSRKHRYARTDWCESGQQTVVPVHEEFCVPLYYRVKSRFGTKFQVFVLLQRRALNHDLGRWLRFIKPSIEVTLKPFSKSIIGAKRFHIRCSENNFIATYY